MKKLFVMQSNYIPWKGYFDAINAVDVFMIYDEVQYTKNDWRNRNQIKTVNGLQWLTLSVAVKGKLNQKINEARVQNQTWRKKHWVSIQQAYAKAPFFKEYGPRFEALYLDHQDEFLTDINWKFLQEICQILEIKTEFVRSRDFDLLEERSERLLDICQKLDVTHYVSAPAAQAYLNQKIFQDSAIEVEWVDYSGYPEYRQLHGEFEHAVSVIDLIFNEGPNAKAFMKSF